MKAIAVSQKTLISVALGLLVAVPGRAADLRANGLSDTSIALDTTTQSKQIQVTSSDGTPLRFITSIAAINPGVPWLNAQQYEGPFTTPATITVSLTNLLSGFGTGPFQATIELLPVTGTGAEATIHVTYTISSGPGGGGLTVSAARISFSYSSAGPATDPAWITVGGVPSYGAIASTTDGAAWLQLSDGVRTGPTLTNIVSQRLTVMIGSAASGLAAGTYQGSIALTGSDNSHRSVAVTLEVTSSSGGETPSNPGSSSIRYQITGLGANLYRYTYYPSGFTLHTNQELDIQFDAASTGRLMNAVAGTGFAVVVQQPNNPSGAPGHYTIRAQTDSLSVAGMMTVDFLFLGAGQPGSQRYYINQLDDQGNIAYPPSPVASGTTINALTNALSPAITSITPSRLTAEQVTTIVIEGSNFLTGLSAAVITATGSARVYNLYVTATQVRFQVKMSAISPVPPYTATVVLTNPGGLSTSGTFPVDKAASTTPRVKSAPAALTLTSRMGGRVISGEATVTNFSSESGGIQFLVAVFDSWLRVTPLSGSTPATLTIFADPRGLSTGEYRGNVTVTPEGGGALLLIPVTFTVDPPPVVSAPTADLTFQARVGASPPPSQTVRVSGSEAGLAFTIQPSAGATWLTVSASSTATPADLTVSVNPARMEPDTYTGTFTVAGDGGAAGISTIKVKMIVAPPLPAITGVSNAASLVSGRVAPGEIIAIAGSALGPETMVEGQFDSTGQLPRQVGGVAVKINGLSAPISSASSTQIRAVVPYELAGFETARVTVEYLGQVSNTHQSAVVTTLPGIYTHNQAGTGPAGWDTSYHPITPNNPIDKGSIVVLYLTGEGQTYPKGVSGQVNPAIAEKLPVPLLASSATIDGQPAEITFVGGVPGMVAGLTQVNLRVPANARTGDLPIHVVIGDQGAQPGVTLSVK